MDHLPNEKPEPPTAGWEPQPVRVVMGETPAPHVVIAIGDDELDVTTALESVTLHLSVDGCALHLALRADVDEIDMLADGTSVVVPGAVEITAEEIDELLANRGMSESAGTVIAEHLAGRARQGG